MHLRIGVHVADFVADEQDIYGTDVNMTARIATLAGPGEIVVSAEVRDRLTAGLDADVEDLGECHLKHVEKPVRAYRVGPPGHAPVIQPGNAVRLDLRPTIAVIPFAMRMAKRVTRCSERRGGRGDRRPVTHGRVACDLALLHHGISVAPLKPVDDIRTIWAPATSCRAIAELGQPVGPVR